MKSIHSSIWNLISFSEYLCVSANWDSLQNEKDGQPCTKTYSKNLKPKGLTGSSYKWKEVGRRRCTEQRTYNLRTPGYRVCAEFKNCGITQEFMKLSSDRTRQLIRTYALSYGISRRCEDLSFILNLDLHLDGVYTSNISTCKIGKTSFSHFIEVF